MVHPYINSLPDGKFSPGEVATIRDFLSELISSLQDTIYEITQCGQISSHQSVIKQIHYWQHAISAMQWAIKIAEQRERK